MWRIKNIFQRISAVIVVAALPAFGLPAAVHADQASVPSLVISQLKITSSNGQFITLYNTTNAALDMSKYQLEYFNHYDLGKATSSRLIALSGIVPPHGYFMVNDSELLLCYQLSVDSVSLGLSSTAGMVQVLGLNQSSAGGSVNTVLQDYVGWSKTAAAGAQTLPSNTNAWLQRLPVDQNFNPAVNSAGVGSWQAVQADPANACKFVSGSGTPIQTGMGQLLPSSEPPFTILSSSGEVVAQASTGVLPMADIGLMSPRVSELLANPNGSGNDSSDEFIELYNPNSAVFDLTGFSLQVGTTSPRSYAFPVGTTLPPNSFVAFYSSTTKLSLSNSGGQAKLIDPFGNSISASDPYGTAKDGQSWALANGKWYWTTKITPGAANIINEPPATKKAATAKTTSAKKTSSKAASTKLKKPKASKAGSLASQSEEPGTTPIHTKALAAVAGAALLYGAYEYRADMANKIHQFRGYLGARRAGRP